MSALKEAFDPVNILVCLFLAGGQLKKNVLNISKVFLSIIGSTDAVRAAFVFVAFCGFFQDCFWDCHPIISSRQL